MVAADVHQYFLRLGGMYTLDLMAENSIYKLLKTMSVGVQKVMTERKISTKYEGI